MQGRVLVRRLGVDQDRRALLDGQLDLLYVAPERLLTPRFLSLLERSHIALFAIASALCALAPTLGVLVAARAVQGAATGAAMKKVYEEAVAKAGTEQEVHARHILVPTEEEAKAVLAEIKKGTDFAELAKQKSKDPGAAAEGGDLGWFGKEQMVPEFSAVAFKLNKGEVSDPVKSQFGWHIIKVEDKRNKPVPEFDKVKEQIEAYVARKAQAEYIAKLRETNKVERLDKK